VIRLRSRKFFGYCPLTILCARDHQIFNRCS